MCRSLQISLNDYALMASENTMIQLNKDFEYCLHLELLPSTKEINSSLYTSSANGLLKQAQIADKAHSTALLRAEGQETHNFCKFVFILESNQLKADFGGRKKLLQLEFGENSRKHFSRGWDANLWSTGQTRRRCHLVMKWCQCQGFIPI